DWLDQKMDYKLTGINRMNRMEDRTVESNLYPSCRSCPFCLIPAHNSSADSSGFPLAARYGGDVGLGDLLDQKMNYKLTGINMMNRMEVEQASQICIHRVDPVHPV
ncbi:MAG TPA: hypothetical protein VG778_03120, partial [Blastocatellia bacterium]|nr:hypothetical protein [Blastocatellia bacterium]